MCTGFLRECSVATAHSELVTVRYGACSSRAEDESTNYRVHMCRSGPGPQDARPNSSKWQPTKTPCPALARGTCSGLQGSPTTPPAPPDPSVRGSSPAKQIMGQGAGKCRIDVHYIRITHLDGRNEVQTSLSIRQTSTSTGQLACSSPLSFKLPGATLGYLAAGGREGA